MYVVDRNMYAADRKMYAAETGRCMLQTRRCMLQTGRFMLQTGRCTDVAKTGSCWIPTCSQLGAVSRAGSVSMQAEIIVPACC